MSARSWPKGGSAEQQADTLAGLHADYVLFILDESGSIPRAVMSSAEAALSACIEGHILQGGNPTTREGPLFEADQQRHRWHVVEVNGDPDNPKRSPRVSIEWARDQIATYGRDNPWVCVNVFGQFPPSSLNALIGPEEINEACRRSYRDTDISKAPRILGIDTALYGDDASVMWPRQGLVAFVPTGWRGIDGTQGADVVSRKWDDWGADACFIDVTGGYGTSWIDNLRRLKKDPIGVGFATKASSNRHANKRTEIYFDAAQWIKDGGQLPPLSTPGMPELMAALTRTTYTLKGDQFQLEPKQMVKEKIGYSPDHADAFCFVGGTKVLTPAGERDIEGISCGDEVLTPFGVRRVMACWVSDTTSLTAVRFSNGTELVGTGQHRVFSWKGGAIRLDALTIRDRMEPYAEWRRVAWKALNLLSIEARRSGFRHLVDTISQGAREPTNGFFIAACGWILTETYQRVARSITRMATGVTMTRAIWSFGTAGHTPDTISLSDLQRQKEELGTERLLTSPGRLLARGTARQRELSGTKNTAKELGASEFRSSKRAFAAEKSFRHSGAAEQSTVLGGVRYLLPTILGGFLQRLTSALGAAGTLWPIGTILRGVVPVSVATESVSLTRVYNLTLDRDNAYYANGLLVFNCLTFSYPVTAKGRAIGRTGRNTFEYDPFATFAISDRSRPTIDDYDPFRN